MPQACSDAAKASTSPFERPEPWSWDGNALLKARVERSMASSLDCVVFQVKTAKSRAVRG